MNINVITVTYGERFAFLEKTLNAIISDKNVNKVIVVDNGSTNGAKIDEYIKNDQKKKIIIIRNNKNEGSAGGFKKGIIEARKNKSDYVLLLDDDNVMGDNWSEYFINILSQFSNKDDVVLKGNRNINSSNDLIKEENQNTLNQFIYMPRGALSYGGTLLPFKAIVETEPPFEPFYLYDDDTEYLFRVSKKYKTYQLNRPLVNDIDHTLSTSNEMKYLRSFDKNVSLVKLFFMTRNQYALPLITKSQNKFSLLFLGGLKISAKIFYAFVKLGINKFTVERASLMIRAFFDGVRLKFDNDENIKRYTR